jgi:hypothetical protein
MTTRRPARRWWIATAAVLGVIGVLAFAAFRPDKLFVDQRVDEQLDDDVAAAIAAAPPDASTTTAPLGTGAPVAPPRAEPTTPTVVGRGEFVGQAGHDVMGVAVIVDGPSGRQLVLSELDAENGPDLQLHLSPTADGSVTGGVKLAPLKGNQGTQTYDLPADVDLTRLANVVIWCERFAVPFGTATLT